MVGEVGGTTAATLAERALVGALIWEPSRARDISRWLEPDDFDSWVDGRIYQVIHAMTAQQRTERLVFELPDALARGLYTSSFGPEPRHATVDWMLRIHERLHATPAPAPNPWAPTSAPDASDGGAATTAPAGGPRSEHVRYARYVLEASARRAVADTGSRIEYLANDERPEVGVSVVLESLEDAVTRLDELAERLAGINLLASSGARVRPPPPRPTTDTATHATVVHDVGEGRSFTTKQLHRAELETVAGALTFPFLRVNLLSRLTPIDFNTPAIGATWAAIADLHQRGDPVDYVTVAWQAEHARASAGTPIPAEQLAKLGTRIPDPAQAFRGAELMTRAAARRHAAQAGHDLHDAARTPLVDSHELVAAASERVQLARHHVQRLDSDGDRQRPTPTSPGHALPSPRQATRAQVDTAPSAPPPLTSPRTSPPPIPAPPLHTGGPHRRRSS